MARTGNNYKKWLRGDNSINIQDRIMGTAHSLIVMCYLNANNSFKDICRTRYGRTYGRSGDYMLPRLGSILNI